MSTKGVSHLGWPLHHSVLVLSPLWLQSRHVKWRLCMWLAAWQVMLHSRQSRDTFRRLQYSATWHCSCPGEAAKALRLLRSRLLLRLPALKRSSCTPVMLVPAVLCTCFSSSTRQLGRYRGWQWHRLVCWLVQSPHQRPGRDLPCSC